MADRQGRRGFTSALNEGRCSSSDLSESFIAMAAKVEASSVKGQMPRLGLATCELDGGVWLTARI